MFLNRTTLIATLSIFICAACVSMKNEAQQLQITNLKQNLLAAEQQSIQSQQLANIELNNLNNDLKTCQDENSELNRALTKSKKIPIKVCKTTRKFADKTILGRVEWVYISTAKSSYKARIDTGAATSSINATKIERFERDGKRWVRFNLSRANGSDLQVIEARIERFVKILQSNEPGAMISRPVVKLSVRIGDITHKTEFTLTDRSHMLYPVLIGRSFLQDVVLVDVSKKFVHRQYKPNN